MSTKLIIRLKPTDPHSLFGPEKISPRPKLATTECLADIVARLDRIINDSAYDNLFKEVTGYFPADWHRLEAEKRAIADQRHDDDDMMDCEQTTYREQEEMIVTAGDLDAWWDSM